MKATIIYLLAVLLISNAVSAQWPSSVNSIEMANSDSIVVKGDLAKGSLIEDLSWAWNSSNACFPATQSAKFKGNHVFYAVTMPSQSELFINVTPSDNKGDLSIYAYRLGANEFNLVPNLERCITCEADHKWDGNWKGKVQTSERKVSFQNPGRETYNILIGISAPKGVTTGEFVLKVKLLQ